MMTQILTRLVAACTLLTAGIAGLTILSSMVLQGEVVIASWSTLLLFSAGVLLWLIPVQIIDWLKLIRVQRRTKRMIFPYTVTLIQTLFFAGYMVYWSSIWSGIQFSGLGLTVLTLALFGSGRALYAMLVHSVRKYKEPRVQISGAPVSDH
ncbi:hypothetical protein [Alkalicoccus chagannorensis]|uniref:hypothetical protein n=1 Tax=Alkalicoccus chagannorensis TaxID=427072 RepID=UPI0004239B4A|nr:hypothetical protein [Alkalicoccus chagannorensis]